MKGADGIIVLTLLYISYIIELAVWFHSLNIILGKKYTRKIFYILFAFGDVVITLIKQHTTVSAPAITVVMFMYMILGACFLYKEKVIVKIATIASIFLLSCVSDIIIAGLGMFAGYTMSQLSKGIENAVASILSKVLLYFIVMLVFNKRFRKRSFDEYRELAILLCSTVICETPCAALFKKMSLIENNDNILILFMSGQIIILGISIYVAVLLAKGRNSERELQARISKIEIELQAGKNSSEILEFRHDIKNHLYIIQELLENGEIDKAKEYLNHINVIPESAGDRILLRNKSLEIILNQKRALATRMNITFNINVMCEVKMKDIDICSIVSNMVDNALEAAGEGGYIAFSIEKDRESEGCFVKCTNTYSKKPQLYKGSFVSAKKGHGHGIGVKIIRKTVEKYNGNAKFNFDDEWFYADIYIPEGE